MTTDTYLRLGHLVYSAGRGHPISLVDTYLAHAKVPRRIEFTVESFLLAPFLLQGTDLVTVVPNARRATCGARPPSASSSLPCSCPRSPRCCGGTRSHTADPAHAWLRARIAEIAAELDRDRPTGPVDPHPAETPTSRAMVTG